MVQAVIPARESLSQKGRLAQGQQGLQSETWSKNKQKTKKREGRILLGFYYTNES